MIDVPWVVSLVGLLLVPGCGIVCIWLVCLLAYVGFVSGCCPFSYVYRGGAVRFRFFFLGPWHLVLFLVSGALPFWK